MFVLSCTLKQLDMKNRTVEYMSRDEALQRYDSIDKRQDKQEETICELRTALFKLNNPPKFKKGQKVQVDYEEPYDYRSGGERHIGYKDRTIYGVVMKHIGNTQWYNEYLVETGEAPDGYRKATEDELTLRK